MIDWTEVDKGSSAHWIALSERLVDKAQALMTSDAPPEAALRANQVDLGEFVAAANLQCPTAAIAAVRRTSDQVTRALQAIHLANLEVRTATFEAIKARMSSAANELRAEAARLRLAPVGKALATATEVASRMRALAAEVKGLRKEQIPARIGEIAASVDEIVALIRSAVD